VLILSSHTVLSDPGTLERYVHVLEDESCAAVSARPPGYTHFDERISWEDVEARGLTYCSIFSNSQGMLRRSCWAALPFDERFGVSAEDYCWALAQMRAGYWISMLDEPFEYLRSVRYPYAITLRCALALGRLFQVPMGWLGVRRTTAAAVQCIARVILSGGRDRNARDDAARHLGHLWGWCTSRVMDPLKSPRQAAR
jgi:hypothetical protein